MDVKGIAKIITDQNVTLLILTYTAIFIRSKLPIFIYFIIWLLFGFFYEVMRKQIIVGAAPKKGEWLPRNLSYIWLIGIFLIGFIILNLVNAPQVAIKYTLSLLICWAIVMPITFFWTISGHAVGIVPSLVTLWYLGIVSPLLAIIIYAIFGWTRLALGAHSPSQYLGGGLLGFVVSYSLLVGI